MYMTKKFGNVQIHELAQEISIDTRLNELKQRYVQKCIDLSNTIIVYLINEFKSYSNDRRITIWTPLCVTNGIESQSDDPIYDLMRLGDGKVIQTDFYSPEKKKIAN